MPYVFGVSQKFGCHSAFEVFAVCTSAVRVMYRELRELSTVQACRVQQKIWFRIVFAVGDDDEHRMHPTFPLYFLVLSFSLTRSTM